MSDPNCTNTDPGTARRRRLKLAIMILVFGPIALFALTYTALAIYKMSQGVPVGYQQRGGVPGAAGQ